jgi:hypothetical protein
MEEQMLARDTRRLSAQINEACDCKSLDRRALAETLGGGALGPFADIWQSHPHLFADTPVYVSAADIAQMEKLVSAIESLAGRPDYRAEVLLRSPAIAHLDYGPRGALMGYDFHLTPDGPRLIEINTNAGGAFLNASACDAQRICCEAASGLGKIACPQDLSAQLAEMFVAEWRLQRRFGAPGLIAIVDDNPEDQYLYPEFLLAVGTLKASGLEAVIADPSALEHREGRLWLGNRVVDLVYNRLVDFDLSEPRHAALRKAYLLGDAVVTPNPFLHAVLADKRNLIVMSDAAALAGFGVRAADREVFAAVPETRLVTAETADSLWAERNRLFFKPVAGHGGKAVYRGDKVTRRVWAEIVSGGYVAQDSIAPSERLVSLPGESVRRKLDVRLYTYAGKTLLAAARLYQGQTTNFRTPGGGFAPVMMV